MTTTHARVLRACLSAVTLLGGAARARANEEAPAAFGRPGTVVLAASSAIALHQTVTDPDTSAGGAGNFKQRAFAFDLAAHVFVASRWSVGVGGSESWSRFDSPGARTTIQQYQVSLRAGRLLPAGAWVSVWPQLGVGFIRTSAGVVSTGAPGVLVVGTGGPDATVAIADLAIPLVLHARSWFFVALGPVLQFRAAADGEALTIASRVTFGAAFDLAGG